jgi:hypothetical protein
MYEALKSKNMFGNPPPTSNSGLFGAPPTSKGFGTYGPPKSVGIHKALPPTHKMGSMGGFNSLNSIYDDIDDMHHDPFGFGSNNYQSKNMSKFTIDELEDLKDAFFEWTSNSIEP